MIGKIIGTILPIIMIILISIFNDTAKKELYETMSQIGIHNEKYILSIMKVITNQHT